MFLEIKHLLTNQCFIEIIQRGLTWRVKLLSNICIWADRCTPQWLRVLSTSLSLASPPRDQSLSFHSTFCYNSPLAVFAGNEPSSKPHLSFTCSTVSAADDSSLSTLTCTGLKETKKAPLTSPRAGTGSAAWLKTGCIAAGLVLPAKAEMQRAQFTKNTTWARKESILLDLPFPTYSLYYTYKGLYTRRVLKQLMSAWLSFKTKQKTTTKPKSGT